MQEPDRSLDFHLTNGRADPVRAAWDCRQFRALGWACRGDLELLGQTLSTMTPEKLTELSAAAAMLGSACEEQLTQRRT
ncbi:hypothetical protein GCM10022226_74150 [Sphaerisporangium flaviroseum]|uniref:Uncharacterized protein n=1 Tax=Sphaerisporangium flaviroseum TaxID=509199 RepID=A0ABP7JCX6_9ACTN